MDKYLLQGNPMLPGRITSALADQLPAETEVLAGIEFGGVPLAMALSLHAGLPWSLSRRADEATPNRIPAVGSSS